MRQLKLFIGAITFGLLMSIVIGCAGTSPSTTPTLTTTPSDVPTMAEEEVGSYIWSKLPSKLPNDCSIEQFSKDTREVTYEGNGKWIFNVSGLVSDTQESSVELVEKMGDYWVEQRIDEVTTYTQILEAVFFEKTELVEIMDVQRSNVTTKTEVDETPMKKEFVVNWTTAQYEGRQLSINCQISNTGRVPLKYLKAKFRICDEE